MLCLGILVAVGMTGLCLGTSLPVSPHQGPLCSEYHSCYGPFFPSCSCDAACRIYGDCCRDSEYYDEAEQIKGVNDYMCVDNVYMRGKCSEDWNNAEVEALCLKGSTLSDPKKRLPVTSTTTARTYVNHYCAICNGEDPAYLRMWYVAVKCLELPRNVYNEDYAVVFHERTWGIIVPSLGLSSFTRCSFDTTMPRDIRNFTRPCTPLVTTCTEPEPGEHEKTLCQSYSAPVYDGALGFRNEHCASCNGYKENNCYGFGFYIPPPLFSMLLDFMDRTGSNIVGFTGPCGPEEVWDKESEKCREIICLKPGEKFIYGKCVPGEDDASLSTKKQEVLCPFRHSCSVLHIHGEGCSCDATCRSYGDCCRDSEYYHEAEQTKNLNEYMCVEHKTIYGTNKEHVYMKGKCSEDWNDAEVEALCLKGNTLHGPTKRLPVTSTTTARTYVNHYCAICNGEDPAYLRMWNAYVLCEEVPSVGNYYDYDYDIMVNDGTWGVSLPGASVSSFVPCQTDFNMPEDIKNLTTQCVPTVKTCSDPGTQEHERTLCQSYAAPVYHDDLRFRNQHCASCNGHKDYTCEAAPSLPAPSQTVPPMILDFSNHTVGLPGPCGSEEVWDLGSWKCRKILCPKPGEKFSYNRCVPAQD